MTHRKLIEQMLDCIEELRYCSSTFTAEKKSSAAIANAKEYLAQPDQLEPVAYLEYARKKPELRRLVFTQTSKKDLDVNGWVSEPLIHNAPLRELTDADLNNLFFHSISPSWAKRDDETIAVFRKFARAVLAAARKTP